MSKIDNEYKVLMSKHYSDILRLVEINGWSISESVKKFGIERSSFHYYLTDLQKAELYRAKLLHRKYYYNGIRKEIYISFNINDYEKRQSKRAND